MGHHGALDYDSGGRAAAGQAESPAGTQRPAGRRTGGDGPIRRLHVRMGLLAHHASLSHEAPILVPGLSFGTLLAVGYGTAYLAAEPYARRYWPDALIAVTRLVSGRIRDPLVAANVLGGLLLNQCAAAISFLLTLFWPSKAPVEGPIAGTMIALENVSSFAGVFLFGIGIGATIAGLLFFAFLVVRIWARRDWIATACLTILAGFLALPGGVAGIAFSTINVTAGMWMLRRSGCCRSWFQAR